MAIKVLIIEDEQRIRKLISDYLTNDGFEVFEAEDGIKGVQAFFSHSDLDLIILDVMMPGKNGWEVCREIREESDVPIIMLTALGEAQDEIAGLNSGADDYITKPFRYEVFMARVRSLLRRLNKDPKEIHVFGDLEVNEMEHEVRLKGQRVEMSPKEYELLVYLIRNPNIALKRETILDTVWGIDFYGDRRTVDTHIKNIRAKIGLLGDSIKTLRGVGYKLEVHS